MSGRWLFALFLCAGAISSGVVIGPARAGAPPKASPASAPDDRPGQNAPRLVWKSVGAGPAQCEVEVIGADGADLLVLNHPEMTLERWTSVLSVRVVRQDVVAGTTPPLWGSYRLIGDIITFQPRFRLEPGMTYRAEFNPARLHEIARTLGPPASVATGRPVGETSVFADFSVPRKPAQTTTQVAAIYPTSDHLPENLLRFYLSFTAPMSRGEAYRRITLVDDAAGKPVDAAFLELDEELWSPDGTRFTLVFDPGRVKRGLKPREELGPILEAGKAYSLVIDREWPDAMGNPLKAGFRKRFHVGQPDETSPDLKTWRVHCPPAHSREPLEIRFPEPLDHALLHRLIRVMDEKSRALPGQIAIGETECRWQFVPVSPWRQGNYRLEVGTELEDVAGNSVARPFEVDVAGPISGQVTSRTVDLPFQINPSAH